MTHRNFQLPLQLFLWGLTLYFTSDILPTSARVIGGPAIAGQPSTHSIAQETFDPPGKGEPTDTTGAGSRGGGKCPQDTTAPNPSMTPLIPATKQGLTTAERPTFFVYVPKTSAQTAFFSLRDEREDYYYQATLPLPQTSGIVSLQLPDDAPNLEIGKRYQWSLVTICGAKLAVDDPRVEGGIRRVKLTPSHKSQLEKLSQMERAAMYRADGIWYDTVTSLADLRKSQPNDSALADVWGNLLKSIGLAGIATKPLVK